MAYIKVVSVGNYSVEVKVAGLDTSYSYGGRYAVFYLGNQQKNVDIGARVSSSDTVIFANLNRDTNYEIECTIFNINDGSGNTNTYKTLESVSVKTNGYSEDSAIIDYAIVGGLKVGVAYANSSYPRNDRIALFALYHQGDFTPIETFRIPIDAYATATELYSFSTEILNDIRYVVGCTIYHGDYVASDLDVVDVYFPSPSKFVSVSRNEDNPWIANVTLDYNPDYYGYDWVVSGYYDDDIYYVQQVYSLMGLSGRISIDIELCTIGKNNIWFSTEDKSEYIGYRHDDPSAWGNSELLVDIKPIPLSFSISNKYTDLTGCLDYEFGRFFSTQNGYDEYMNRGSLSIYIGFEGMYDWHEAYSISSDGYCMFKYENNEQSDASGVAWVEIWDNGVKTHVYEKNIYYPPRATITLTASRDETNPQNIYASVWVDNAYSYISKIKIVNSDSTVLGTYSNPTSYPIDFTFYNMGIEKRKIYARVYRDDEYVTSNNVILEAFTPLIIPWTWDDSNGSASQAETINAYNAIDLKLNTTAFSYLVWNDLIEKVREAYRLKGGGENTVYEQYLNDALMNESDEDNGKVLLATRFNNVRKVIGGALSTFNVNDNAIYDHYENTANWDMQSGEKVLGEYIKALTTKLNEGIE